MTLACTSLRWAFEVMRKGYYTQSVALSRTAWEAWLNAAYLNLFPERSIEEWRDKGKRPRPKEMRELVAKRSARTGSIDGEAFHGGLDELYSHYSGYAHPTADSLQSLVYEEDGVHRLSLAGHFSEPQLLRSTNALCCAAVNVASLFAYLLPDPSAFLQRRQEMVEKWKTWGNEIVRRFGDGEPPSRD